MLPFARRVKSRICGHLHGPEYSQVGRPFPQARLLDHLIKEFEQTRYIFLVGIVRTWNSFIPLSSEPEIPIPIPMWAKRNPLS